MFNYFPSTLKTVQVDPDSGRIFIDGIDITTIGLHDLRSRVVSASLYWRSSLSHSHERPLSHRMQRSFRVLSVRTSIRSVCPLNSVYLVNA